jgi:hypothetical protein
MTHDLIIDSVSRVIREVRAALEHDIGAESAERKAGEKRLLKRLLGVVDGIQRAAAATEDEHDRKLLALADRTAETIGGMRGGIDQELKDIRAALNDQGADVENMERAVAERVAVLGRQVAEDLAVLKASIANGEAGSRDTAAAVEHLAKDIGERIAELHESELSLHVLTQDQGKRLDAYEREIGEHIAEIQDEVGEMLSRSVEDWEQRYAELSGHLATMPDLISKAVEKTVRESKDWQPYVIADRVESYVDSIRSTLRGPRGPEGKMARATAYSAGVLYEELDLVVCLGAVWQAKRKTEEKPGPQSHDWICLADGIASVRGEPIPWGLDLVVSTASGIEERMTVALPRPTQRGTFKQGTSYKLWDEVYKDRNRFRAEVDDPQGQPGTSDDWSLQAMCGPAGKRGPEGPPGPEGRPPPVRKILDAWADQLSEDGSAPITVYRGNWSYGRDYRRGDVIEYNKGMYVSTADARAEMPPDQPGGANWQMMIRATTHAGTEGTGGVISSDSSVADMVTLTQAEYDALETKDATTLYLICG